MFIPGKACRILSREKKLFAFLYSHRARELSLATQRQKIRLAAHL